MLQLFFIVKCGIASFVCAMRVSDVRASSSFPRLPLRQNIVCFAASIAELTYGEKSHTQSLTQSPSLPDALGTEAKEASENIVIKT